MKRNLYDLGHHSFVAGQIGKLQTLTTIPVLAGDSIQVQMTNIMRFSPLRRELSVDAQVDYFAFFVPHRHIYGADWETMIKEGVVSAELMPTLAAGVDGKHYLATSLIPTFGSVSKWLFAGYNRIWNRYFRYLKLTPEVPDDYVGTGTPVGSTAGNSPVTGSLPQRLYGFPIARLKKPFTTGNFLNGVAADREVASATVLDIVDLDKQQQIYKTVQKRDWYAQRYSDVMKGTFGTGVNTDADERPTLLMHTKAPLSGRDVDGTGDANLGTFSGKSISAHNFGFRRKFFNEHGTIWIMTAVRFPTMSTQEIVPQLRGAQNYTTMAGDPNIIKTQEPVVSLHENWLGDPSTAINLGIVPFGQAFRSQPNVVHWKYEALQGYPFLLPTNFNNQIKSIYVTDDEYDTVFQTDQLGNWHNQATIQVAAHRMFPTVDQSIFAGV